MAEKKVSKLWIAGLVALSVVFSSVVTQVYLMPGTTLLQRLDIRKEYGDCLKKADHLRESCRLVVKETRVRIE